MESEKIIQNTIKELFEQDPDSHIELMSSKSVAFINSQESLHGITPFSSLVAKFTLSRHKRQKTKSKKTIHFICRKYFDQKIFPIKTKIIKIPSRIDEFGEVPETTFSIKNLINLPIKDPYLFFLTFLHSIYYGPGMSKVIHPGDFYSSFRKLEEKRSTNILDFIKRIQEREGKGSQGNFEYVCNKYGFNNYFSNDSDLDTILENNEHIVFVYDKFISPFNTVYRNILCLFVCYISEYLKGIKTETTFFIDDINNFISLDDYGNNYSLADIFEQMKFSLLNINNDHQYLEENVITHNTIMSLITTNTGNYRYGINSEDAEKNIASIINFFKLAIFNMDTRYLSVIQKQNSYPLYFTYGIIYELGNRLKSFYRQENPQVFPFIIGHPGAYKVSGEINWNQCPLVFNRSNLTLDTLYRLSKLPEIGVDFKLNYHSCVDKIIDNVVTFLNNRGGNIFIGFEPRAHLPVGLNIKKEPGKNFPDLVESINQKLISQIVPSITDDLANVQYYTVNGQTYLIITVFPGNGTSFSVKGRKTKKRFGTISHHKD